MLEGDLEFELEGAPLAPSVGSGRSPAPIAPPRGMGGGQNNALDNIFDGIDIAVPKGAAPPMTDSSLDAGDFMGTTAPSRPAAPQDNPTSEWGPPGGGLGADLLAAFNAADTQAIEQPAELTLMDRLRSLAEKLRAEGRVAEADLVTQAVATLSLQS